MKELENSIRSITMDGLLWGTGKLVEIGYVSKNMSSQNKIMIIGCLDSVSDIPDIYQPKFFCSRIIVNHELLTSSLQKYFLNIFNLGHFSYFMHLLYLTLKPTLQTTLPLSYIIIFFYKL